MIFSRNPLQGQLATTASRASMRDHDTFKTWELQQAVDQRQGWIQCFACCECEQQTILTGASGRRARSIAKAHVHADRQGAAADQG